MPSSTSPVRPPRRPFTVSRLVASTSAIFLFVFMCIAPAAGRQGSWPGSTWPLLWWVYGSNQATWMIDIQVDGGPTTNAENPSWLELTYPGAAGTVKVKVNDVVSTIRPLAEVTDIQVRYVAHGVPVSGWLSTPFTFTLSIDNPALDQLPDGLHDLSLEVQGGTRNSYSYRPIYLHLARGRQVSDQVPIIGRDVMYQDYGYDYGPAVKYVRYADAHRVGRPVDPSVTPWHGPTISEPDLYQEEMAPHTDLFMGHQMWWEQADGPHAGQKFTRSFNPKWDEEHRGLRVTWFHERFPFIDGPKGIAWTSTYVSGQIDSTGGFVFAEAGGPVRYMEPNGTVTTIVGWRVQPGKDPIWVGNATSIVRRNMEFRSTFQSGRYSNGDGFRTPLDVTIDPHNERIWYAVGYEDHCVWKIDATDFNHAVVSVFAGDPNHTAGFSDGVGGSARFAGPSSLVFDPVSDSIYVADQDNDAIRRVNRNGEVSTVVGMPGMAARLRALGVTTTDQYIIQAQNRAAARYEVSASEAQLGIRPDIYVPQTVRVDSHGNLIVLEVGFGSIRKINPTTLETHHMAAVNQTFENNSGNGHRGWAWLDVDRWGNAGPLDSVYYGAFQASWCDGETETRTNEAYCWMPASGGPGKFIFNDWAPNPDGWGTRENTDPPHYMWLAVVDPRGAVLFAGGGEHGITRLRKRKPTDPVPPDMFAYSQGKDIWRYTSGLALKFGWEAHGYLGFANAADYKDATDAELINAFEIPASVQGDPTRLQQLLMFIRVNGGKVMTSWTPPPPAPPPPPPPASNPVMALEAPVNNTSLNLPVTFSGWAVDAGANTSGTGVDAVHVWACPVSCSGSNAVFWGSATYGGVRADVAATFGNARFTNAGYTLAVSGQPAGLYQAVVYARSTATGTWQSRSVVITIAGAVESGPPGHVGAYTVIDAPGPGATALQPFALAGWAVDGAATAGTGVDRVQVWGCAVSCTGSNAFLAGEAVYGGGRPDVAASLGGSRFMGAGFGFAVRGLPPGQYELSAYAHSTVSGQWRSSSVTVDVRAQPLLWVDAPVDGAVVQQPFGVSGWAIDTSAAVGTGVDAVHVWAYPNPGSNQSAVFWGAAAFNVPRPDVAQAFGSQFATAGWNLSVSGRPNGTYMLVVYMRSAVSGQWTSKVVTITISTQPITGGGLISEALGGGPDPVLNRRRRPLGGPAVS